MSLSLYRKYRPQRFSEIVEQDHIIKTITGSLMREYTPHAYLFSGPRGTGKTTIARILAKSLNCTKKDSEAKFPENIEPCNKCSNCNEINNASSLDLVEIDAASNRGIDEIRELKEKIKFTPAKFNFKIYIIDEVHMLTKEAFNALLKTLEEPPNHAIFILATTELDKIPATIISRCSRYDFKRLSHLGIIKKLSRIAKAEKINIDEGALKLIASNAEGGARDAESLFNQVIFIKDKKITAEDIKNNLGIPELSLINKYLKLLLKGKTKEGIQIIKELYASGSNLEQFSKNLLEYLRKILHLKIDPSCAKDFETELTDTEIQDINNITSQFSLSQVMKFISLLFKSNDIDSSDIPSLPLEMATIEFTTDIGVNQDAATTIKQPIAKPTVSQAPPQEVASNQPVTEEHSELEPETKEVIEKNAENEPLKSNTKLNKTDPIINNNSPENNKEKSSGPKVCLSLSQINQKWPQIVSEVSSENISLGTLLKSIKLLDVDDNELAVSCDFGFYKDKLEDIKNRSLIETKFNEAYGEKVSLCCYLKNDLPKKYKNKQTQEVKPDISAKTNESISSRENKVNISTEKSNKAPLPENKPTQNSSTEPDLINSALEVMGGELVEGKN